MIIDCLDNAERYLPLHPGFAAAFRFLREMDFEALESGSHWLEEPRLRADVIRAAAKPREQIRMEVHRRYLDLQFLVWGEEQFSWKPAAECVQAEGEYDPVKDRVFYSDEPVGWFPLRAGMFAIFFPEDAHGPMLGEGELHKVVLKVAVDWESG